MRQVSVFTTVPIAKPLSLSDLYDQDVAQWLEATISLLQREEYASLDREHYMLTQLLETLPPLD